MTHHPITIGTNSIDVMDQLVCPCCGGPNLHHGDVAVYHRHQEDAQVNVTVVSGREISTTSDVTVSRNPSSRRDGITIAMECEECNSKLLLGISQHKGSTYFTWHHIECEL